MAAQVSVSLKLDDSQLKKLPLILRDRAHKAVDTSALIMEGDAAKNVRTTGRVKTGNLADSSVVNLRGEGFQRQAVIAFRAGYSLFVHNGTGLFGPKKDFIRPKTAKFLSWIGADGKRIYARKVKGMPGTPFLADAMETERPNFEKRILG